MSTRPLIRSLGSSPVAAALLALTVGGCGFWHRMTHTSATPEKAAPELHPVVVRSFSETAAVTALVPLEPTLWVGTTRGLLRWDTKATTFTALGKAQGLPGDRVIALAPDGSGGLWVLTEGGLARESKGGWKNQPPSPLGTSVTAMATTQDGALYTAGSEGLARLRPATKGPATWERLLGATPILTLVAAGNELWVGTGGKGVARVVGDKVELFGRDQGLDLTAVKAIAPGPLGVVAVGQDEEGAPRLALWDKKRWFTYKIDSPAQQKLDWVRVVGGDVVVGDGQHAFALATVSFPQTPTGPVRLAPLELRAAKPAVVASARGELPSGATASAAGGTLLDEKPAAKSDGKPASAASAQKAAAAAPAPKKGEGAAPVADGSRDEAPRLDTTAWGPKQLPEGVTVVAPGGTALYLGTQFLGATRIDGSGATDYRTADFAEHADHFSVACETDKDCYVANGGPQAFRYDGAAFEASSVDPEAGSRVLAVVGTPQRSVIAIHRGPKDSILRMSTAADGNWSPISVTEVTVPEGVPEITFARFAPTHRLWLGLHYIDRAGDRVDYGAVEVSIDRADIVYHRQFSAGAEPRADHGVPLPNDMEAAYFRSASESWFGTRRGAVRLTGKETRTFTENDGLESEFIRDIIEGPDGRIWVATSKGVGSFDGTGWHFPDAGSPLRARATSLARDRSGAVYVGTDAGLVVQTATSSERLDAKSGGLLDDHVLHLAVDRSDRVWVMTEKGLSLVQRRAR